MLRRVAFVCMFILMQFCGFAQRESIEDSLGLDTRRNFFFALPALSYTPETRWGIGAVSMYNFYLDFNDTISPASSIQLWAGYTQNKQILVYLPFNFTWKERKNVVYGQAGYYQYFYYYYGFGDRLFEDRESYNVDYPRVRLNYLRKIYKRWYLGGRMWYEDLKFRPFEEGSRLDVLDVPGDSDGAIGGLGLVVSADYRDNIFYPTEGWFVEGVLHQFSEQFGAYNFVRQRLDVRNYQNIKKKYIFANQLFIDHTFGDVPFFIMPMLGGPNRMRGMVEGTYRDQSAWLYQAETRFPIYKRFGAVVFGSAGGSASHFRNWQVDRTQFAVGGGLRFNLDTERNLNVRLDAAATRGQFNYYITIGEAF